MSAIQNQKTDIFNVLDPISLILSHKLTTDPYFMERGPRYTAYAELRESKLRTEWVSKTPTPTPTPTPPPAKKQVKFKTPPPSAVSTRGSSMLAQSVPDFSAALRKENRKPPPLGQLTPPPSKNASKLQGGSRSVGSGEKRRGIGNGGGGLMGARKSYANVEELKGLSIVNGESRRVISSSNSSSRGNGGKTVLGYRHLF
ncbi:hypothetical protein LINPERHAP1_LOCUS42494 [Linum perenne]